MNYGSNEYERKYYGLDIEAAEYNAQRLRHFVKHMGTVWKSLEDKWILDVGCGNGYWLRQILELGADPEKVFGIDLTSERFKQGVGKNPRIKLITSDARSLPFADLVFDLVIQNVCFMTIPLEQDRRQVATEMSRVLARGGYIYWWDLGQLGPPYQALGTNQPEHYWSDLPIARNVVGRMPTVSDCLLPGRRRALLGGLIDRLGYKATHVSALLGPKP